MRLKSVDIGSAYFADQPHAACMPCVKLKHGVKELVLQATPLTYYMRLTGDSLMLVQVTAEAAPCIAVIAAHRWSPVVMCVPRQKSSASLRPM